MNEKGDKDAIIVYTYNKKYDTYSYIDVRVYDESGKLIKKYHKSDMYDGAASNDETLVRDERFLGLKHICSTYPGKIEVSYEEDLSSFIDFDTWVLQQGEQSVAKCNLKYHVRIQALVLNIIVKIYPLARQREMTGNSKSYNWSVSNRKAFKIEEGAKTWRVVPKVEFAINNFNCYGYPGDISSWQSYGKWVYGSEQRCLYPKSAARLPRSKK